ncbi:peptidoglycan-binding domain 1 protein [Lasiosphaeria hispida]|uniref:Peptidoglycan-binding domain 1 protein n=1 Tax=Lasiosphaeria hispida TaxID=260671 RepID=A0AAJ0HWV8_9PEZI|nr:peptidoglycan-binding domain 1 protein [Lasiosphaeria hispida]
MRLSSITALLVAGLTAMAADCNRADYFKPGAYNLYMPFRGNSINCQLAQGNNSDAVKALQTQLNLCYGSKLDVDGDFGGKTKTALKAAQKAAGADDDGIYGPETRSRIKFGLYFNGNPNDKVCKKLSDW